MIPDSLPTDAPQVLDSDDFPLINRGICPECGETRLAWSAGLVNTSGVVDGRLTMRDVETQFWLGCEECSETLISGVSADEVAAALTAHRWRP